MGGGSLIKSGGYTYTYHIHVATGGNLEKPLRGRAGKRAPAKRVAKGEASFVEGGAPKGARRSIYYTL